MARNNDGWATANQVADVLLVCIGMFVGGFTVALLSIFTKNAIDNTILPLVVLFIVSLVFIKRRQTKDEARGGPLVTINMSGGSIEVTAPGDGQAAGKATVGENQPSGGKPGKGNPGNKPDPLPLRYNPWVTSIILIVLCLSLVTGTFVGNGTWARHDERQLEHNLTGLVEPKNPERFSFIAFGDTRSEVWIPSLEQADEAEIKDAIKARYGEVADKDIDLRFWPDSLRCTIIPERLVFSYSSGWPRVGYRLGSNYPGKFYDCRGHRKVFREVARRVNPRKAKGDLQYVDLAIHTGDVVLWSDTPKNVYWAAFDSLFYRKLKQACFSKRFYPAIGNHEYWRDSNYVLNFFKVFPHLKPPGSRDGYHYYAFKYGNSFFISLCSGEYITGEDKGKAPRWTCRQADYLSQMAWLKEALLYARDTGVSHIFITCHKPPFTWSKHPPLERGESPADEIAVFKRANPSISMTVFSGHNHTTEAFSHNGVNYLVLGGGGAPQHFCDDTLRMPDPPELYWRDAQGNRLPREERYNFLKIDVNGSSARPALHTWEPSDTSDNFTPEPLPPTVTIHGAPSPLARGITYPLPLAGTVRWFFQTLVLWSVMIVLVFKVVVHPGWRRA
jgi:hypothetical protein